jgi:hypothetical protein
VEDGELTKKLDESTFTERVVDRCMESDSGSGEGEVFDPSSLTISLFPVEIQGSLGRDRCMTRN